MSCGFTDRSHRIACALTGRAVTRCWALRAPGPTAAPPPRAPGAAPHPHAGSGHPRDTCSGAQSGRSTSGPREPRPGVWQAPTQAPAQSTLGSAVAPRSQELHVSSILRSHESGCPSQRVRVRLVSGDGGRVLLDEDAWVLQVRSQCRRKRGAEGEGGCWGCSQGPPTPWPGTQGWTVMRGAAAAQKAVGTESEGPAARLRSTEDSQGRPCGHSRA